MQARGRKELRRGRRKLTKGPDHLTPAEGRRLIAEARKEAERIMQAATVEVEELRDAVRQRDALIETIRTVLRQTLPNVFDKLRDLIREAWSKHPLNPNRPSEPKSESAPDPVPRPPSPRFPGPGM